ncbi:SDR family NAD(P)-dependent oxidoreductase [Winogradskyella bathintestinalis]|uniref:SDR family NAD(P)-dependent oxidoreductase n=1 Tax=Winogradskyella bathintestinalis TaxID=3035208 RepID=A0ABT7ZW72_9FLAO|nr:SDR family NAD(P)-dependent oxidoreductase [Winogradskyella bathintestinalis]MDN3493240.1 SDR family NAD(P)-dependent oxidoreductase [Winogradskyella bathintestinalis]
MKKFSNKTVLITGGSGGIGTATAALFLKKGANVMLVDIDEEALKSTSEKLNNDNLAYIKANVTDEKQVKKYVDATVEKFGSIDIFFNNAGVEGKVLPLDEYPLDIFNQVIDVNIKGVYYGLRHVFPVMKENGGSIIITSSVSGLEGTANVLPYVTSKHAVIGMMRTAALEGAPHNIRVNTVNPSPVDNRMMRSLEAGFAPDDAVNAKKNFEAGIPLGRYATNEDVAYIVEFLASDKSAFITGTVNSVDGGMTA